MGMGTPIFTLLIAILVSSNPSTVFASFPDITDEVLGNHNKDIFPVAFADYDSDKLTDVVVLHKNASSFDIYFGATSPPFLNNRKGFNCDLEYENKDGKQVVEIVGLQIADFTGDGVSDICISFVLKEEKSSPTFVTVLEGNIKGLNCRKSLKLSKSSQYLEMSQEPLVVDINGDMIADLVGENIKTGARKLWTFYKDGIPEEIEFPPCSPSPCLPFANPTANSFVDTDGDFSPELVIISEMKTLEGDSKKSTFFMETYSIEETYGRPRINFENKLQLATEETAIARIGNPVWMDMNLKGSLAQIIPYCTNLKCHTSGFLMIENDTISRLDVKFQDNQGIEWGFLSPKMNTLYSKTIHVRVGDFNLDGYPDMIGTLMMGRKSLSETLTRPVIFENVPCQTKYCKNPRTFQPKFDWLDNHNSTITSTFYDVHEDGLLDVMVVRKISGSGSKETFGIFFDRNKSIYDSYFIKWIMTTGLCETNCPPYGVRSPGASMVYNTIDRNSNLKSSRASQYFRTHFGMDLPYTVMGCGPSSNFIDSATFGLSKTKTNTRSQIIPNSILIVIPPPPGGYKWQVKHLLTPSVDGAIATLQGLLLICVLISSVIFYFWMKERKEDRMDSRNRPLTMSGLTFT